MKHRGHDHFRIDLKEPPQPRPGIAPAESVRAERYKAAGNPRGNLIRDDFHVIRYCHESTVLIFQHSLQIRFSRLGCRMEHVSPSDCEGFRSQKLVACGTPHIS